MARGLRKFLASEQEKIDLYRVDTVTLTTSERAFTIRAHEKMMAVHRPSWPDFLVEIDGETVGVEVKAAADGVSPNQRRTFDLLEKMGLKVFIWDESKPDRLLRWPTVRATMRRRAGV